FPGSQALDEKIKWVEAVTVAAKPPNRLTLTLPVLNGSRNTYFLPAGAEKKKGGQRRAGSRQTAQPPDLDPPRLAWQPQHVFLSGRRRKKRNPRRSARRDQPNSKPISRRPHPPNRRP